MLYTGLYFGQTFLSTPSARRATMLRGELEPIGFLFLSTPSARRATVRFEQPSHRSEISIHALREEGDMPAREREVSCW